jgi:hypothetical protein
MPAMGDILSFPHAVTENNAENANTASEKSNNFFMMVSPCFWMIQPVTWTVN